MSKVLIVEDEIMLQEVYKMVLLKHSCEVSVSSNGLEGLQTLSKVRPDIVFLDVFMPVMDGKEFLRNFSKTEYPNTKIVVYTNLSDSKTETEMLELGADKFVLKSSMTPQDLTDLVDELDDKHADSQKGAGV